MILVDTLIKFKNLTENAPFDRFLKDETFTSFSPREKADIKDLIAFLTLNNLWTAEDLKNNFNASK